MPANSEKKRLIVVLACLCLLILVFLFAIVIINVVSVGDDYQDFGAGEVNCSDINNLEPTEVVNCLGSMYDTKGEEKVLAEYSERIDRAFAAEDDDLFYVLLVGRASLYYYNMGKGCDESLKMLDDDRIVEMSLSQQLDYYQNALAMSMECENESRTTFYRNKIEQLYEKDKNGELSDGAYE